MTGNGKDEQERWLVWLVEEDASLKGKEKHEQTKLTTASSNRAQRAFTASSKGTIVVFSKPNQHIMSWMGVHGLNLPCNQTVWLGSPALKMHTPFTRFNERHC